MKRLKGLGGAAGSIKGTAVILNNVQIVIEKHEITDADAEIARMNEARIRYRAELEVLKEKAKEEVGENGAAIFSAYQEILEDDVFFNQVIDRIKNDKVNIEYAIDIERKAVCELFEQLDDVYMKERGSDVNNVCMELIAEIQGVRSQHDLETSMGENLIIVAEDLTPAETIKLDKKLLKGFVTERGGITSHTVILAKTLDIPAVVGVPEVISEVNAGDTLIVYGDTGEVIIAPDDAETAEYMKKKKAYDMQKDVYDKLKGQPAVTKDGFRMKVSINSGDADSIEAFDSEACDGVGLFRTEFLYMNHDDYPTEEEQFEVYKAMTEKAKGKELIIRTLDIGGDKQVPYMNQPKESNPFLGYRAIRLCFDRVEVFKTQLHAILRAGVFGDVKIMFPMIVNMEELLKAKVILEEAKAELEREGAIFKKDISVGIMIETPAAVLLSDKLAQEVDFFSIGSNDLIQYTTATDRMNQTIQWLYDSCNISVLRAIKAVADNAKKYGIMVGICGEAASEGRLVPIWAAMGIDELSVVPSQVGKVKYIISKVSGKEMQKSLYEILDYSMIEDVRAKLAELESAIFASNP